MLLISARIAFDQFGDFMTEAVIQGFRIVGWVQTPNMDDIHIQLYLTIEEV